MVNCEECGQLLSLAESISCTKCPRQFHSSCVNDRISEFKFICGENGCPFTGAPGSSVLASSEGECSLNRELTCILFPAVVKNVDKALQCLGGIKHISQVFNHTSKKRLGLTFQPDNPFIKKIYADNKKSAGVLLKVKLKKVLVDNEMKREVISTDVVGRVNSIYKYESMCDFQYLPVTREGPDDPLKCLIDDIIPSKLETLNFIQENHNTPLYIVPANFTRSDRSICYAYTDKRYPDRSGSPTSQEEVHTKSRSDRGLPQGHWWHFNLTDDFPDAPNSYYIMNRDMRAEYNSSLMKEFEVINKCFQERPIWSLNLIKFTTKIRLTSLKVVVPCVAVYMKGGPWKSLWVRFGFDPRKEHSAMMYQTLDFRLRHTAGVHSMVTTRDQVAHYKSTERVRNMKRKNRTDQSASEEVLEGAVIFRPGMAPTQRQIFYQLCDVKLPEVEHLIQEAQAQITTCHKKSGWLPINSIDECRDHISRYVKDTLLATHSEVLKYEDGEGGSSDEEDPGDEITNAMDETMQ